MKRIILLLIVFSFTPAIAQSVYFERTYTLEDSLSLKSMFAEILEARRKGDFSRDIWDSFGVGEIYKENLKNDGSLNYDNFVARHSGTGSPVDRTKWSVEARRFTTTTNTGKEINHYSIVTNDKGFKATSDKVFTRDKDGNKRTVIHKEHTFPDGTRKISHTETITDADGNSHTRQVFIKKDVDGNIIDKRITERNSSDEVVSEDAVYDKNLHHADDEYYKESAPLSERENEIIRSVEKTEDKEEVNKPYDEKEDVRETKELIEDLKAGKITQREFQEKSKKIGKGNPAESPFTGLPQWAIDFGLPEVKGFKLIDKKSYIMKETEVYNRGFKAIYTGASGKLIAEAKRLTAIIGNGKWARTDGRYYEAYDALKADKNYGVSIVVHDRDGHSELEYEVTNFEKNGGAEQFTPKELVKDLFKLIKE